MWESGSQVGLLQQYFWRERDTAYSNFEPEDYKTQQPLYQKVTSTLGGIDYLGSSDLVSIYGSPTEFGQNYFVLNHRGYIFAEQTGTYTFSASGVDDIVFVWVGPDAYSGWNREDATLVVAYSPYGPGAGAATAGLVSGQYYPLRILFAQAQGPAVFAMQVSAPDGTVILDSNTQNSPYLVQYGCEVGGVTTSPEYPTFGAET